jgi:predicted metal-dependent peptidase
MNKANTLAKASKDLMWKEPFYGFFLIMLNKVWDNKRVPTAGVSKNGINYQLAINEDFWMGLSENHRVGLLKHELLHIAYFHLTQYFNFSDKRLANVAMDMEINQYIDPDYLPDGGINIDDYADLNLDRKAGTRYYYDALKRAKDEKDQTGTSGDENFDKLCDAMDDGGDLIVIGNGSGNGEKEVQLPDHSTWEEFENLPEAEQKLIEKQLDRLLNEASEQTVKKRGTVPGHIENHLIEANAIIPPKFDWRGYIRRFTGVSTKVYTKKIRRKENRRYSDNPGIKIKMKQHMLLGIDTSGSVSDNELKEFMNEIYHIYKCGVDVTIIQCDTNIKSIEPYKGKNDEFKVHGRGGTEFDPVLEYYNANLKKYTSLVYFTDGECYTTVKPKSPVLWVLSERSSMNEDLPGKVIKLEL